VEKESKNKNSNHLKGTASAQYYMFDSNRNKNNYEQPSFLLNLKVENINGTPVSLNLKYRTRLIHNTGNYPEKTYNLKHVNRLYDLSLEYGGKSSSDHFEIGRIRNIRASGIGGIDGALYERKVSKNITGGIFTGMAPELESFIGEQKGSKNGLYLSWNSVKERLYNIEFTASYIHEKQKNLSSMDFVHLYNSFFLGNKITILNEAAFNISPKGTSFEGETLQNIRSYASYAPVKRFRFNMCYTGYIIPEYGNFDASIDPVENIRYTHNHTFMPSVDFLLPYRIKISGEILGGRNLEGKTGLLSYGLRSNFTDFYKGLSAGISQIETLNFDYNGHHTLVTVSKYFLGTMNMNLQGNFSRYDYKHLPAYNDFYVRAGAYQNVGSSFFYLASFTHSFGKYIDTNQLFLEIGSRLGKR